VRFLFHYSPSLPTEPQPNCCGPTISVSPQYGVAAAALGKLTLRTRWKALLSDFSSENRQNRLFGLVRCVKSLRAIASSPRKSSDQPVFYATNRGSNARDHTRNDEPRDWWTGAGCRPYLLRYRVGRFTANPTNLPGGHCAQYAIAVGTRITACHRVTASGDPVGGVARLPPIPI
jgi:hypothetical protein